MIRSILDPAGPQAGHIAALWWLMLWVCVAILILVTIALLIALFRAAARTEDAATIITIEPNRERSAAITVGICVAATGLILFIFLTASVVTGHRMAQLASDQGVTIKLTGYRWWWKVEYSDPEPAKTVITANEIHVPIGRPVLINTHSQDVIHSFWITSPAGSSTPMAGGLRFQTRRQMKFISSIREPPRSWVNCAYLRIPAACASPQIRTGYGLQARKRT